MRPNVSRDRTVNGQAITVKIRIALVNFFLFHCFARDGKMIACWKEFSGKNQEKFKCRLDDEFNEETFSVAAKSWRKYRCEELT